MSFLKGAKQYYTPFRSILFGYCDLSEACQNLSSGSHLSRSVEIPLCAAGIEFGSVDRSDFDARDFSDSSLGLSVSFTASFLPPKRPRHDGGDDVFRILALS